MTLDPELVRTLLAGGPSVILLVIVVFLVADLDRAERLKALLLRPLFLFRHWCSRSYMAAEVASKATAFLKIHVSNQLPSLGQFKVRVKWVKSTSDPVLRQDGTLILRLRETNDQTLNTILATCVALPNIVCPTLRASMQRYAESAIDLTLLRSLAEKLGRHARPVFQREFLAPGIADDPKVAELFEKLVHLDEERVFVPVFLEECSFIENSIYGRGSVQDVTDEVIGFLEFLLTLVDREVGEEIPLEYHSEHFHVAVLLLALAIKAETEGVRPYLNRVDRDIKIGCDSIYIIAFPPARTFMQRVLKALEADQRLSMAKRIVTVRSRPPLRGRREGMAEIALMRANRIFGESSFCEKTEALELGIGSHVSGVVLDVSHDWSLINVGGLNAFIRKTECSWLTTESCQTVLEPGQRADFFVKDINWDRQQIELSCRFPAEDPWQSTHVPEEGEIVSVVLRSTTPTQFIGLLNGTIEVRIPFQELSWTEDRPECPNELLTHELDAVIYERSDEERKLLASPRRLVEDPWPDIHRRIPKGSEFEAKVVKIAADYARVELPTGLTGIVPKKQFEMAGYEYRDHEANLIEGQVLHVVVTKVFIGKRRIRLALKRNIDA